MKNIISMPQQAKSEKLSEMKYSFDLQDEIEEKTREFSIADFSSEWMEFMVKAVGIILLLFGLGVGIKVMLEVFHLYRDPIKIETFARAIEKGSNIDKTMVPVNDEITTDRNDFRLSYFAAWVITLSLLLLISMIAFAAIKTGGELVLLDSKAKRLSKE